MTTSASTTASDTATGASTTVALPPPIPDDNFLDVSYSTDGQTWISIGEVNINNWQQFTVTLPISDWTDLQDLQVRVEGIPTTQAPIPPIYLDGMLMEVHYEAQSLADQTPVIATTTSGGSAADPTRMTLVNRGAQQSCDIQPFSQLLPLGGIGGKVGTGFLQLLRRDAAGKSQDAGQDQHPGG